MCLAMIYTLFFILVWLLGAQVQFSELRLLSGLYHYRLQTPQFVTYTAACVLSLVLLHDLVFATLTIHTLALSVAYVALYIAAEWAMAKCVFCHKILCFVSRLALVAAGGVLMYLLGINSVIAGWAAGLYFRNNPFGVVYGKPFWMAYLLERKPSRQQKIPLKLLEDNRPCINVADYGILPNTGEDMLARVQELLDEVGQKGGGRIFFPKGRYLFNRQGRKEFLTLNYSHVTIEGECDERGQLLTELVNCGTTIQGVRNPWLSPFFITTGEALQPSNKFWGLQFRKPSGLRTESSSLSDPGSDGSLLTPPLATRVIEDALCGSRRLKVEQTSTVGKYILLGLYNTDVEGSLIKDILGIDALRPEWLSARRAGPEEAPSYQWLTEVSAVIDMHTIELVTPLHRDCLMQYEPHVFNVEILEDIHLRHLRICSTWNGLFRHHGFPLYYNVAQTQEMDYGWNAINMKRVAHASLEHLEIKDFTNPLYVQDSRAVKANGLTIKGYDGHQGIKMYCHTSDCLFEHIDFRCHFADMMGGEGNAYGNIFSNIRYLNPTFKPVDYDFHGFSEGPMSPPAHNLFEWVEGFRYIKGAGAIYHQPACAQGNEWRDCLSEGNRKGYSLFYAESYRVRSWSEKFITTIGYTVVMMIKRKRYTLSFAQQTFKEKWADIELTSVPRSLHAQFFPGSILADVEI